MNLGMANIARRRRQTSNRVRRLIMKVTKTNDVELFDDGNRQIDCLYQTYYATLPGWSVSKLN